MNPSQIRRCIIEPEEIWSKNTEEKELIGNFAGLQNFATCEISQVANFRNLRTLLTCVPTDCFLTRLLVVLYKFSLMYFWFFYTLLYFLILSTYISSVLLVIKLTFSLHQSIKEIWHEASSPSVVGDFLFFSLHFLAFSW